MTNSCRRPVCSPHLADQLLLTDVCSQEWVAVLTDLDVSLAGLEDSWRDDWIVS